MDKLLIKKIVPKSIFLTFYSIISICLIFSRPIIFVIVKKIYPEIPAENIVRLPWVSSMFALSGMALLLLASISILTCGKTGLIFSIIFADLQILLMIFAIISKKGVILAGFFGSGMTIFFCYILYVFLKKLRISMLNLNITKENLQKIVYTDELTSLASRKKITDTLRAMASPQNLKKPFAIMFIDMDNFKLINDTLGHKIGDLFLQEAAHNISRAIEPGMLLGRMGGDEFLLIIPGVFTDKELETFASKITTGITHPFIFKNEDYSVTCSIGIARYPFDASDDSEILRFADMALYQAKEKGKNRAVIFDDSLRKALRLEIELHSLIDELDSGIEILKDVETTDIENMKAPQDAQFYLLFQPQFIASNQKLRGFEVLSRLNSKDSGNISPSVFIPVLEKNGDIVAFSKWVIKESIHQYLKTVTTLDEAPLLCVNVSTVQFRSPDFIDFLRETLKESKMPPEKLEIEITESVIMYSADMVIKKLNEIHEMGIKIALDDFGTGYSSFNYLRLLPFDLLKIDKTFVDPLPNDVTGLNIIRTIINMAHGLKMEVIAEGVENKEQYELLRDAGCDFIQGYYFSKPAPLQAL